MSKMKKISLTVLVILMTAVLAYAIESPKEMKDLKTEFLCELKADLVLPPQLVGQGPHGTRMIVNISGGTIEGPKLNGKLLPGADYVLIRPDGATQLDVRGEILTHDGKLIYMQYRGISVLTPATNHRLSMGEPLEQLEYQYHMVPIFETGAEEYRWLNKVVAVGVGMQAKNFMSYKIYVIR